MQARILLIIFIFIISHWAVPVSADFKGMVAISAEKLFGLTKTCNVEPHSLQGGDHLASFDEVTNSLVYYGPSILCPTLGLLDQSIPFVVSGEAKSRFGKPWYHVTTTDSNPTSGWVPGKYLALEEPVAVLGEDSAEELQIKRIAKPESISTPNYTIDDISAYPITPSIDLNVRACASTSCEQVSVLIAGSQYTASKRASNGWVYIEVDKGQFGWVSGKYINVIELVNEKPSGQAVLATVPFGEARFEKPTPKPIDPCEENVEHIIYTNPIFSRAINDFWVKTAPQQACGGRVQVKEGQAIITLGATLVFEQIAFLDVDGNGHLGGYALKDNAQGYYLTASVPKSVLSVNTVHEKLIAAEQYWQSGSYRLSLIWADTKSQYAKQPQLVNAIGAAVLFGLLMLFPFTRKYVMAVFIFIGNMITRRRLGEIASHWHTMIQGLDLSPREFYQTLENVIHSKQISDAKLIDVRWKEGGIFSAKRLYFRVKRKEYAFDICCAPFGSGTFFSYWMGSYPPVILAFFYKIPIISWLAFFFEKAFRPDTYWRNDTMTMFQSLIHSAVLETVDHYTNEKGLKPVATDERKPKMKQFFDLK